MKKNILIYVLTIALLFALTGCESSNVAELQPQDSQFESVEIPDNDTDELTVSDVSVVSEDNSVLDADTIADEMKAENELTETQKKSIAMLNYLAVLSQEINSSKMVEMLKQLNLELKGKVGLKIHYGEPNGPYFLGPDFLQEIYDYTEGTYLECNTAYTSVRSRPKVIKNF